jgi:hypothetical protein
MILNEICNSINKKVLHIGTLKGHKSYNSIYDLFITVGIDHTISSLTMDAGTIFVSPGIRKMVNIRFTRM